MHSRSVAYGRGITVVAVPFGVEIAIVRKYSGSSVAREELVTRIMDRQAITYLTAVPPLRF
jgi:hypothetical protein